MHFLSFDATILANKDINKVLTIYENAYKFTMPHRSHIGVEPRLKRVSEHGSLLVNRSNKNFKNVLKEFLRKYNKTFVNADKNCK